MIPHLDPIELLQAITVAQSQFIVRTDAQALFDHLLRSLLKLTGSEYGFIGEVQHEGRRWPYLRTHALTNVAWNEETRRFYEEKAPNGLEFYNLDTLFGHVLVTRQPVISNDPRRDPRSAGTPPGHPSLRSFLGLPFHFGDEFIGMVGIANRPGGYDQAVIDFLHPFLITCSQLIYAYRLDKARKTAEERLLLAKESAEVASREKSRFLATINHELRTPMNAIIGFTDLLRERAQASGDADFIEEVDAVHKAGRHLRELIANALDFARSETGDVQVRCTSFALAEMLEEVQAAIRPLAAKNGNSFSIQVAQHMSELYTDRQKLKQILLNLLSNACKFTQQSEVKLLCFEEYKLGTNWLVVRVRDNGIGFTDEQLPRLFEPFYQADSSDTRAYEGTGLGLAISKKLVELLKGSITAEGRKGVGATLTVTIPVVFSTTGNKLPPQDRQP